MFPRHSFIHSVTDLPILGALSSPNYHETEWFLLGSCQECMSARTGTECMSGPSARENGTSRCSSVTIQYIRLLLCLRPFSQCLFSVRERRKLFYFPSDPSLTMTLSENYHVNALAKVKIRLFQKSRKFPSRCEYRSDLMWRILLLNRKPLSRNSRCRRIFTKWRIRSHKNEIPINYPSAKINATVPVSIDCCSKRASSYRNNHK